MNVSWHLLITVRSSSGLLLQYTVASSWYGWLNGLINRPTTCDVYFGMLWICNQHNYYRSLYDFKAVCSYSCFHSWIAMAWYGWLICWFCPYLQHEITKHPDTHIYSLKPKGSRKVYILIGGCMVNGEENWKFRFLLRTNFLLTEKSKIVG